jgi:hypothetical protein
VPTPISPGRSARRIFRLCRNGDPARNHAYQSRIAGCVQNARYSSPGTISRNSVRRRLAVSVAEASVSK